MNLMCFADHLNSLLLIFCSFSFILALLFHFVPTFNINLILRMHLIQKYDSIKYMILLNIFYSYNSIGGNSKIHS